MRYVQHLSKYPPETQEGETFGFLKKLTLLVENRVKKNNLSHVSECGIYMHMYNTQYLLYYFVTAGWHIYT